ncbi:hypothetical protein N8A98_08900 [Devosia neptuniae]|uniref:Uncharacterized protein n=1 Tax=Devosia neptuniae TaxID=191302 RepID=A0ABY6CHI8_9HYPH|nr:hypothetical protein [Devosia neptuniae]UXN71273.1 hypothetical protein N8A98_08900 [Devosia neptuniae]
MTFQLIDIEVQSRAAHPRLAGRTTGRVRAVLSETRDGREQTHDLSIAVWADLPADASDADIDMALMLKAADIVARLKSQLEVGVAS